MSTSYWQRRRNAGLDWYIRHNYQSNVIEMIAEKKIDIEKAPGYDSSPLSKAASWNRAGIIEALLAAGANPEPADADSDSPLLVMLGHKNAKVAEKLVDAGADLARRNAAGATPLLLAAELGAGDLVAQMVAKGAHVDAKDGKGQTALHLAAEKGFGNIVQFLMEHGANASLLNSNMNSAADVAERNFPRLAAIIRGEVPPPSAAAPPEPLRPADEPAPAVWKLVAPDEVALVAERPVIGYRLTEIFNFGSGIYTRLARSLETGAESQAVRFFEEFPDHALLDRARDALVGLGGSAPEAQPSKALDKPLRPAPGGPK